MAEVFRPWDAGDDEYAARLAVRELIPAPFRPALQTWLSRQLDSGHNLVAEDSVNAIQSALGVSLGLSMRRPAVVDLIARLHREGDQFVMRVTDYLLSNYVVPAWTDQTPAEVLQLSWHLDQSRSAVRIEEREGVYRLRRRLADGVEEMAAAAASDANAVAGRHLRKAWNEIRGLQPNTSAVMTESIRAVEAAAAPVVISRDKRPQLARIVSALKQGHGWTLRLPRRDDDYPDQREVLIGMLEILAFAEKQRHSGSEPDEAVALAHLELASTLVGWFSSGVVFNVDG